MIGSKRYVLVAGLLTAVLFAGEAHAGFQWTAPVNAGRSTAAPSAPAMAPVSPVVSEALPNNINTLSTTPDGPVSGAPIYGRGMTDDPVTWNAPHNRAPQVTPQAANQSMPQVAPRAPQSVLPVEATSLYTTTTTAAPTATPAPVPSMMAPVSAPSSGSSNYQVADGFGRDLPLVMAIRQIVPSQYGFVFDDGIDLSAKVSWQGGKPWDTVLQQTLSPLGLAAGVRGNVVSIMRAGTGSAMSASGPAVITQTVQDTATTTMAPAPMAMETKNDVPLGGYVATPASTLGASPPANLEASITWTSSRNSTLRGVLEDWSKRAGVELYWASEYDYPIQSAVSIQGTFEEAVQVLLKGLTESRPRPMGRLHPNLPDGPAVLVIETRQNSM